MSYRVYGRTEYAEPLRELGTTEDRTDVNSVFNGDWVELIAFPEGAMHWIIRDGENAEDV